MQYRYEGTCPSRPLFDYYTMSQCDINREENLILTFVNLPLLPLPFYFYMNSLFNGLVQLRYLILSLNPHQRQALTSVFPPSIEANRSGPCRGVI